MTVGDGLLLIANTNPIPYAKHDDSGETPS